VIQVSTKSGDLAVFVTEKYVVHEVRPKLQAIINKICQGGLPVESALLSPVEPVPATPQSVLPTRLPSSSLSEIQVR